MSENFMTVTLRYISYALVISGIVGNNFCMSFLTTLQYSFNCKKRGTICFWSNPMSSFHMSSFFFLNWRYAEKPPDGVAPPKAYTCHAQQHKGACKIISWSLILGWFWSLNHFQSTLDSWQLQELHPWNFTLTPNKNRVIKRIYIVHLLQTVAFWYVVYLITCILNLLVSWIFVYISPSISWLVCQPAGDLAESLRGGPKRHRRDRTVLTVETMLRYLTSKEIQQKILKM